MVEKFGLKNMNKYKISLSLDENVSFLLTDRGQKHLQESASKDKIVLQKLNNTDVYTGLFSDFLSIFGSTMFVGAFNTVKNNTVSVEDMAFNLNDKISFTLNENGKKYLNNYLEKEQKEFHLLNKRVIREKENATGRLEMTLHDFAYTFSQQLSSDNNILENNSVLEIEYQ